MTRLGSKLPDVGTTIFSVMSQLAQEHDAINLSQGFPDFAVPQGLADLVARYINEGKNQYPPSTGVPALREQIALKANALYGASLDMDREITVTSGATEALFVAIQTVIGSGDEAIILDPAFDCYDPAIRLAGGQPVHVALDSPAFAPDWARIEAAVTSRTRLIIVNTPHNPTGTIFTAGDLDQLASLAERHDLFVLSDEVYEHMVYDDSIHHSVLTHEPLRTRAFTVSSFGKTYHATGWKVAFCAAPADLTAEFRKIHQFVTFTTHTPTQWALAEFMRTCPEHYLGLSDFYQKKRDRFLDAMSGTGFIMQRSAGTYFQLADYGDISSVPDTEFVRFLTTEVGVAAIPMSAFYETPPSQTLIRFCFCKDDATLIAAAERLQGLEHA